MTFHSHFHRDALRGAISRTSAHVMAFFALMLATPLFAATITVNSVADTVANDGFCTLREAIIAANTNTVSGAAAGECAAGTAGLNVIAFSVAGKLQPATPLPDITTQVHVNGYSAPGAVKNTLPLSGGSNAQLKIEIDNALNVSGAPMTLSGASASGSIVEGLVMNNSVPTGNDLAVYIKNVNGVATTHIRGNYFGVNVAGSTLRLIGQAVYLQSTANVVVGSGASGVVDDGARNIIAGAVGRQITVTQGSNNLVVRGNLIGTNALGTAAVQGSGSSSTGVFIDSATNAVVVDNVISGNGDGVRLIQAINGVLIARNLIGTNAAGNAAVRNTLYGIQIRDAFSVTPFVITDVDVVDNVVANNGCISGGCPLSGGIVIGVANPVNVVKAVRLSRNLVYANTGLQVDLTPPNGANGYVFGVTANDLGDVDFGPGVPNNLQNFPVLSPAIGNGTNITVPYSLNSEASKTFTLEFFQAASCDASGHGGARVYLGMATVVTDVGGNVSGTATLASALTTGVISATATQAANGTSELSLCASLASLVVNIAPTITSVAPPVGTIGSAYSYAVTASGTTPITFSVSTGALPTGLILSTGGVISGTPTAIGTFSGTITAVNGTAPNAVQAFSITIAPITFPPVITSALPPNGTVGSAYSFAITATGTAPLVFGLNGGVLPPGLTLGSASGLFSGTPTTAGTFVATLKLSNGTLPDALQVITIIIAAASPVLTAPTIINASFPPGGTVGIAYSFLTVATGSAPITFSIGSGGLPPGVTINATTGVVSGTPNGSGTFSGTIVASNGTLPNSALPFNIVISPAAVVPPTVAIGNVSLAEGNAGTVVMNFPITLSSPAPVGGVTITYSTADGTATAGSGDYVAVVSGTATIAAGLTSGFLPVTINGDTAIEANETFTVQIISATNATLGQGTANPINIGTGTILNDDVVAVAPAVSVSVNSPWLLLAAMFGVITVGRKFSQLKSKSKH